MNERKTRENAPSNNITLTFDWWVSEHLTACNACWFYQDELNLDDGRFEKCLCGKDGCRLVWCRKSDREARQESCAELRFLHENMEISEDLMFSLSEPGDPVDEILTARYFMRHNGGVVPPCPVCETPMTIDRKEGADPNIPTCPGCGHAWELPADQGMIKAGAVELPGMQE